jgi:hypothetical protein
MSAKDHSRRLMRRLVGWRPQPNGESHQSRRPFRARTGMVAWLEGPKTKEH